MDAKEIIAKLKSGKPLFHSIPAIRTKRVFGTEIEFGSKDTSRFLLLFEDNPPGVPFISFNGGEVYLDTGAHLEYASPETSNPLEAVVVYEAGKILCQEVKYGGDLYCHNRDSYGDTFGSHENYFTKAHQTQWRHLVPFLVARTIMCGIGWVSPSGAFEISQRAGVIKTIQNQLTTDDRPIINTRFEPLSSVPGWDRMHIICGDATMSEVATFLRIGTMGLMVELLERGALPEISYNDCMVIDDLHEISRSTREWVMPCILHGPKDALELLMLYCQRAKKVFYGRDLVTNALLAIWEDTIHGLAKDPLTMWGRIDWVTKMVMLDTFRKGEKGCTIDWLQGQDMEYHNIDPKKGLYYHLRHGNHVERLVSDELILNGFTNPPDDTRAYTRGNLAQILDANGYSLCNHAWDTLRVVHKGTRLDIRKNNYDEDEICLEVEIPNPLQTYKHLIPEIMSKLYKFQ